METKKKKKIIIHLSALPQSSVTAAPKKIELKNYSIFRFCPSTDLEDKLPKLPLIRKPAKPRLNRISISKTTTAHNDYCYSPVNNCTSVKPLSKSHICITRRNYRLHELGNMDYFKYPFTFKISEYTSFHRRIKSIFSRRSNSENKIIDTSNITSYCFK